MKQTPWFTGRRRLLITGMSILTISMLILVACGGTNTAASTPTAQAQATPTSTPTATPTPPPPVTIQIVEVDEKYYFKPDTITIKAGTKVIWVNHSDAPHTVTSDPGAASAFATTDNVTENKMFEFVFTTPGTYAYHCNIHPYMKASITVTP